MKVEYILVKKKTGYCDDEETFKSLLNTNGDLSIEEGIFSYKGYKASYSLRLEEVEDRNEVAFHLIIESNAESEEEALKNINHVGRGFRRTVETSKEEIQIYTIWDEASHYYCLNAYPKLNAVENLMRKLLYQFFLKSIGSEWIKKALPTKTKDSISQRLKRNHKEFLLEYFLYESDFLQLKHLLFDSYSTKTQGLEDFYNKLDKEEDEASILEFIEEQRPQSNWDRYFSKFINSENLDAKWEELYGYRNTIAHNKLIRESDYNKVIVLVDEIIQKLSSALEKLDKVVVPENEKEDVSNFARNSIQHALNIQFKINNILQDCKRCGKENAGVLGGICNQCWGDLMGGDLVKTAADITKTFNTVGPNPELMGLNPGDLTRRCRQCLKIINSDRKTDYCEDCET